MRKIMILLASVFSCAGALRAQNLDPTIEVSREYEGKLIEVHKPSIEMAVPDSLYRFDLGFDYSVFENPYKGSYEFIPYMTEMRPSSGVRSGKSFYLRAGAGYTLHPTLDLLWSPVQDKPFTLDVYAEHDSYVGEYRAIGQNPSWNGYDLLSKAGADLGYDWKKACLDFGASYYGIADKDYRRSRAYNAVDAYAVLKSKRPWPEYFMYELSFSYRFAVENNALYPDALKSNNVKADLTLGPNFRRVGKLLFDIGAEVDTYAGAEAGTISRFYLVPHYVFEKGRLKIDAGVRISALANADKGQLLYPDVKVNLAVIPDAMKLYLNVGGGDKINTYSSLLEKNHHLDMSYGSNGLGSVVGATVERVSAVVGLVGRITNFFSYDIRGGYVNYGNAPLEAVAAVAGDMLLPALSYTSYQKCFAAIDWDLNVQNFRFDGTMEYTRSWNMQSDLALAPSALTGNAAVSYDWNKRILAGVDCEFATSRTSVTGFTMLGYADLGVSAEYVMNKKISFWLRGGNLLNMEIQRNLLFAEKGINFTAGICLSF